MQKLNFPDYTFRFKNSENKVAIFDEIRKKFILLTPEEWVRQHVIQFLIKGKMYPKACINVEKNIKINSLNKRYDIIVYQNDGSVFLLVECKAPEIMITQNAFDQIARYNMVVDAQFMMVTNGFDHYFCKMDYKQEKYVFLEELPDYKRAV